MADIMAFSPLWGEWEIKELIGEGAFGSVYRAEKRDYGHLYVSAVKHLSIPGKGMSADELIAEGLIPNESALNAYYDSIRNQIIKEINFCYTLKGNTNIVSYEDHCIIPKKELYGYDIFIRMEHLVPLTKYMRNHNLTEDDVIRLGIDICTALEVLHQHQMLHRDIKPANIFVNPMGVYKLGDFGESKVLSGTSTGISVRGTYSYMSPEIFNGLPADITADIYSLGMAMYRILNDHRSPFIPPTLTAVSAQIQNTANSKRFQGSQIPPPSNCQNPKLTQIVLKACEFDRKKRWQTPEQMKMALLQLKGIVATPMTLSKSQTPLSTEASIRQPSFSSVSQANSITYPHEAEGSTSALLRRAFAFLQNGQFRNASQYCDRILATDPGNGYAYLGKLMADLEIRQKEQLGMLSYRFDQNYYYQKIIQYGTPALRSELQGYLNDIDRRNPPLIPGGTYYQPVQPEASLPHGIPAQQLQPPSSPEKKPTAWILIAVISIVLVVTMLILTVILVANQNQKSTDIISKKQIKSEPESSPLIETSIEPEVSTEPEVSIESEVSIEPEVSIDPDISPEPIPLTLQQTVTGPARNICASYAHTVGLNPDGTVVATGANDKGQCNVKNWRNVIAVACGTNQTLGLKSDGTVYATGLNVNKEFDVSGWRDIVAISVGFDFAIGLRSDGTVVSTGSNAKGQREVSDWTDIVAISAGSYYSVGLKSDGTVVATTVTDREENKGQSDVGNWRDIVAISAGYLHTVGIRSDGTVVSTGDNSKGQRNVSDWTDIVAVSAKSYNTIGLHSDGTVEIVGQNNYGQLDGVSDWTNVIAVSAGSHHIIALRADGTLFHTRDNEFGQTNVSGWKLKTD